jgi:hypothetical protein
MLKGKGLFGDLGLDKSMKVKINPRRKQVETILFRFITASSNELL